MVWRFTQSDRDATLGDVIDPDDIEVLLVHRPRYNDWSWPKGKTELNEPLPVAAVREVEEETGLPVTLGAPLTIQRYRLGAGHIKEVHYWVGQACQPDSPALLSRPPVHQASRREIDNTRWVSPSLARRTLTRRGDRRLLDELVALAESGGLVSSTLAIVRHSKAVKRGRWEGSDADRPLARIGVRQSIDLIDLMSAFGITKVLSSSWRRCASTVGPYASLTGIGMELFDELDESAMTDNPAAGAALVNEAIENPGSAPTIICAHRPTLPALFEPIRSYSPSSLHAACPAESPWLKTAQMLLAHIVMHEGGPCVVAVETYRPLTKLATL